MLTNDMLHHIIGSTIIFIKKYSLLITAALVFLLFMFLLIFYSSRTTQKQVGSNTNSTSQVNISTSPSPMPREGMESDERGMTMWTPQSFSESDLGNTHATTSTLPDGSLRYSYDSDTPNRPTIIIVKNGIKIFQRITMYNTSMGAPTVSGDTPEYIAHGSSFWGQNAVTYIYLSKGFAYVGDPSTNHVFEQIIFQPIGVNEFKQKYGDDIVGDLKKY